MNKLLVTTCVAAASLVAAATTVIMAGSAAASTRPVVTHLSTRSAPYWGGTTVTVRGSNLGGVTAVKFGASNGWSLRVVSPTTVTVIAPWHNYGRVVVRLVSASGSSARTLAAAFTFRRARMSDRIQGNGLTGYQERSLSRQVRLHHHNVGLARRYAHWTPAMGLTAVRRARSWLGLPYAWDGGNAAGPTTGRCVHNGGDLDCRIVGFDCSGLALYSWSPYKTLDHYSATQHYQAGRFHPTIGELEPGDLLYFGYGGGGIDHTAVYAGNGNVIQAPESGQLVTTTPLADFLWTRGVYRGATRPLTTGSQGPSPVLSVVPATSVQGGLVTITGRNLADATSVLLGGTRVYRFVSRTSGRLVVRAPAHPAGTVGLSVSNAWGTSNTSLTYVSPPQLTGLSPSSGSTIGGTAVTLYGRHLSSVVSATVGGLPAAIVVSGPSRATVVVPPHAIGTVPIEVRWSDGASNALSFTFVAPSPSLRRADQRSMAERAVIARRSTRWRIARTSG